MKHGESVKFENLPKNIKFKVTENDYSEEGYTTYIKEREEAEERETREITGKTIDDDYQIQFRDHRAVAIPTDTRYEGSIQNGAILALGGFIALLAMLIYRRKRHHI